MSLKDTLLFSFPKHAHDMRMLIDRVLEPDAAHPLVRDLLESIRANRFGEAQLVIHEIRRSLGLEAADMQAELAALLFANAVHSPAPLASFQYLLDTGFKADPVATELLEHLAIGDYFSDKTETSKLLDWFMEHGGLIPPDSKAAWRALQEDYPEAFARNHSRYEMCKLESYIRSQSLEVREVARL